MQADVFFARQKTLSRLGRAIAAALTLISVDTSCNLGAGMTVLHRYVIEDDLLNISLNTFAT